MVDADSKVDLTSCRICLTTKKPLCPLFKYKLSGNYAEMLTAIADVKVSSNDGLPEKICIKCCTSLEKAYLLKTVAERSDRKLRKIAQKRANENISTKKIAFDSFTDIKSEIGPLTIKSEPKWEMEIDVLDENAIKSVETMDGKDIVIANTVIRKVEAKSEDIFENDEDNVDLSWNSSKDADADYIDEDVFYNDDDDDDDYLPPLEKTKTKFKKPKLCDIKVFKGKKTVVKTLKVLKKVKQEMDFDLTRKVKDDGSPRSTTITCYPILKNGTRGPAILLRRPKDATILKIHPNYKARSQKSDDGNRVLHCDRPMKSKTRNNQPVLKIKKNLGVKIKKNPAVKIKKDLPVVKQREKLVCPVCGILTYTLGNHIATHEEKKKYNCSQCTRSFVQKSNLLVHMKQHTGVKDHICEICGAGFYTQKSLVRHNLIHKGERPFSCELCTKKFIARCDLNRHLRIHAGYKPYKCSTCTMSFNAKHQLQNHERMHTGERPYTCEICNVAFSYKVNLNNHVIKIHGVNLKFKSIHTVTEEVLRREMGMSIVNEEREAIAHIMPQLSDVPTPAAHETVHHTTDYTV